MSLLVLLFSSSLPSSLSSTLVSPLSLPLPPFPSSFPSLSLSLLKDGFLLLILLPWWHCDSTNNETCTISSNGVVYFSSYSSLPVWVQVMMAIRSLRPLHLVSLFWSLRSLIREILEGYKNLIAGTIIMIGFMFMFASLGVQVQYTCTSIYIV